MVQKYVVLFFMIIFCSTIVFTFIGVIVASLWKIFIKAGEEGKKSLIPICNVYILITKIARKSETFFYIYLLDFTAIIAMILILTETVSIYKTITLSMVLVLTLTVIISFIILFILTVNINLAIAKNFDKSKEFAAGLTLLPFIFYLLLAFGDSKFIYSTKEDNLTKTDGEILINR